VAWTEDGDVAVGPDGVYVYEESEGLRTLDAVSPSVTRGQVLSSLFGFGLIYLGLTAVWLFVLDRKIREGPAPPGPQQDVGFAAVVDSAAKRAGHEGRLTGDEDGQTGGRSS
jgi:hypothetical protein